MPYFGRVLWFVLTIFGFLMRRGLGCPHHQETTQTHVLLFIHVGDQKWTDKYKWPLVNLGVIQDSLIIMSTRAFSQNPSNLPYNPRG